MRKKIVCLGGGSNYFIDAIRELVLNKDLNDSEVMIYDINLDKAKLMADYGKKISEIAGVKLKTLAASDLSKAVDGADFAISSIGGIGGGKQGFHDPKGVHIKDILTCAKYGIFQVVGDTGGPAAMMTAFRSIPIYMEICKEMEKRCPNVILFNHSNPMAILCRAMNKYTKIRQVVGMCHGVQKGKRFLSALLNIPVEELDIVWVGTNHYHWFTEIYHKGKSVYDRVKELMPLYQPKENEVMFKKFCSVYGYQLTYPSDNHIIEFYPFLTQLKNGELPYRLREAPHGPEIMEAYIKHCFALEDNVKKDNHQMSLKEELDKVFKEFTSKIEELKNNKGLVIDLEKEMATGESLGNLIADISVGRRNVYIVNIPNKGAVSNLPSEAVLEIEGVTDSHGIRGIHAGEAPLALKGLLEKAIAMQEIMVDAGVKGDKKLALQALMLDEMAILPDKAESMLNELLINSKNFLPQFNK
ncbi:MAG: hypothetical protein ABIB46_04490 [bacterium]